MRLRALSFALLAAIAAPALAADPPSSPGWVAGAKAWVSGLWSKPAGTWLERIGPALREQNYQGTLVIVSGSRVETVAVFHAYKDGRERMRMLTLSGARREVVRDNRVVMVIGSQPQAVGYDSNSAGQWNPAEKFADAASLQSYQAKLGGTARIAGREAQVIELQAKDQWRYGFRLWLDKETALPLRIALLGEAGLPLEQIAFTDLQLGGTPSDSDLRPSSQRGLQRVQSLEPGKESDPGWRVQSPPTGFRLTAARHLGESVQLLYSDGLANVSVYIEPASPRQRGESTMRRGAVNAYSLSQNGRRVVAIGKVPAATVAQFARNVRVPAARDGDG